MGNKEFEEGKDINVDELRKDMENIEKDPEKAFEAAVLIIEKYGRKRGWG